MQRRVKKDTLNQFTCTSKQKTAGRGGMPRKSKWVQEISVECFYFGAFFFNDFRSKTYGKYPIIFGDETDRVEATQNPSTPEEILQSAIDFYYNSMMLCANDDILKINPVLKLSLNEVLGYLSYRLDKANKERQRQQNSIS